MKKKNSIQIIQLINIIGCLRSGSSDSHHRQGTEKPPSASGGTEQHQRKESKGRESESGMASGSGQPHPEKKKPMTKAERRAIQVYTIT